MKNKELRQDIIVNGKYCNYTKTRYKLINEIGIESFVSLNDEEKQKLFEMELNEINECEAIRNCKAHQRNKIENHIKFLFDTNTDIFFATFTFDDDALKETKEWRKLQIRRLLTKVCDDYILNIDYGAENEREHYHAVLSIKKPNIYKDETNHTRIKELDKYKCGFYKVDECKRDDIDKKRLARYITKLTHHSIKVAQQYVSVKKGSKYQEWIKLQNKMKKQSRGKIGYFDSIKDFQDEYLFITY